MYKKPERNPGDAIMNTNIIFSLGVSPTVLERKCLKGW
jgi:hypothetical protein